MKKLISLLLVSALVQALVQAQTFEAAAGSAKADLDNALAESGVAENFLSRAVS